MQKPTRFEIKGLFGTRDIDIPIESNALILVGPNGIGKSCVTNIFYFFISRQWARLAEYDFKEVAVWFGPDEVRAARADISGLSHLEKVIRNFNPSSRISSYMEKLRENGLLDEFVSARMTSKSRDKFANALSMPVDEVRHLQMSILRRFSSFGEEGDMFPTPRSDVEKQLIQKMPGRTLFLPTYRRIEKDLRDIFPDLEERVKSSSHGSSPAKFARSANHYVDLVSFGMEDVRANIDSRTRFLRDYSLAQFNDLSGLYLRDVIKGTADQYSPSQIASLDEDSLAIILGRVSEQVLSAEEKSLLRSKILDMKGKKRDEMEVNDLYLAHYFSRLMSASADISSQETEIISFVEVCNAYLKPGKQLVYDDTKFTVEIIDDSGRPIDLSVLSSGEKQVVSLFSHLYLDDAEDQIVIIDEPELSLSVPWQKRFLTDILKSTRCGFIFSVTHSPFIYQNELRPSAIDLRLKTSTSNEAE
ncbi:ATP-binding protein [Pseudomonas sp. ICBG1301]|uniref:AAA family ATPase n=1 Tax=Pseudomonas sp. ICBG1301 TaxID=2795987 RepID=UPI001966A7DE|nr:AAA family ATPase [Pseudomonas sp. ICBG1301]MBM9488008.1 ATP-binding protein [Pseudomonas sp. ICBG1301]